MRGRKGMKKKPMAKGRKVMKSRMLKKNRAGKSKR